MNDLSDIGLFRRELRDVRAVVANIDHRTRKLIPVAIHRPAGLVARYAACKLIAIKEKRQRATSGDGSRQSFPTIET